MTDKVALVTGAGSGIGKATAKALASVGYAMVLAGRRPEPLEALAKEIGGKAIAVPTDVGDPKVGCRALREDEGDIRPPRRAFQQCRHRRARRPPRRDHLRAMVSRRRRQPDRRVPLHPAGVQADEGQSPRGGRIINNGSISAHAPRPNSAPYTATKHAITGLTKSTALDGRAFDIACGQIDIGNAATEMAAKQANGVIQANGTIAVEPLIDTNDVARAIVYMASLPLSSNVLFMTVMATKMPFVGRG